MVEKSALHLDTEPIVKALAQPAVHGEPGAELQFEIGVDRSCSAGDTDPRIQIRYHGPAKLGPTILAGPATTLGQPKEWKIQNPGERER